MQKRKMKKCRLTALILTASLAFSYLPSGNVYATETDGEIPIEGGFDVPEDDVVTDGETENSATDTESQQGQPHDARGQIANPAVVSEGQTITPESIAAKKESIKTCLSEIERYESELNFAQDPYSRNEISLNISRIKAYSNQLYIALETDEIVFLTYLRDEAIAGYKDDQRLSAIKKQLEDLRPVVETYKGKMAYAVAEKDINTLYTNVIGVKEQIRLDNENVQRQIDQIKLGQMYNQNGSSPSYGAYTYHSDNFAAGTDVAYIAKSQVGITGGDKYKVWYGGGFELTIDQPTDISGAHWCAMFVLWCADKAGYGDRTPHTASVPQMYEWYESQGRMAYGMTPKVGDFYIEEDLGHVEIVVAVDGGTIYTVAGNGLYYDENGIWDGIVDEGSYPIGTGYICVN